MAVNKKIDCPKGYVLVGGKCVSKIAAGIIGAGAAGMATEAIQNFRANKPVRQAKRAAKKNEDLIAMKKGGNWIQGAIKKPGALREQLGVKKGEKIPKAKLEAAAKKGGKLGQRARLAITLGKMKKK